MPQLDIIGAHPPSNLQAGMKTVKALMSPLEIPTRLDHTNRTHPTRPLDRLEVSEDRLNRNEEPSRGRSDAGRGFSQREE